MTHQGELPGNSGVFEVALVQVRQGHLNTGFFEPGGKEDPLGGLRTRAEAVQVKDAGHRRFPQFWHHRPNSLDRMEVGRGAVLQ